MAIGKIKLTRRGRLADTLKINMLSFVVEAGSFNKWGLGKLSHYPQFAIRHYLGILLGHDFLDNFS